jgi:hypothetical protein
MRVMVMAAGKGPGSGRSPTSLPKPMAPIASRPVLHHILRLLGRHGLTEVVANLHHMPNVITGHFGDGAAIGVDIHYSFEPELLGTAGGVKNNEAFLGTGTFLVMSGDALTDIDLTGLVAAHRRNGSIATMAVKEVADPSLYGVVVTDDDDRVVGFQEKPTREEARSHLCNCGIYVFEPEILSLIPAGEFDDLAAESSRPTPAARHHFAPAFGGYWSDVGNLRVPPRQRRCSHGPVAVDAWREIRRAYGSMRARMSPRAGSSHRWWSVANAASKTTADHRGPTVLGDRRSCGARGAHRSPEGSSRRLPRRRGVGDHRGSSAKARPPYEPQRRRLDRRRCAVG